MTHRARQNPTRYQRETSRAVPEFLTSTPKAIQWLRGQRVAYVPPDRDEKP